MGLRCTLLQIGDSAAERIVEGDYSSCGAGAALDLDKAWGGIHYLLSGSTESGDAPERFLMGGHMLEETSEHVAIHRASAVVEFDAVLKCLPDEVLLARIAPAEMNRLGVYPGDWSGSEKEYLAHHLSALRAFISEAAASAKAISLTIL